MDSNDIIYRAMEPKDLKDALDCFTAFDLEESLSTLEAFYECDPKAFYVAINKADSLYAVDNDFQGKGIGKKLFSLCMEHIGDRNCGLFAVEDKLSMYQGKAGFKVKEGVAMIICNALPENWENLLKTINESTRIEAFDRQTNKWLTDIIEYDSKVHREAREKLVSLSLHKHDYNTFVAIDNNSEQLIGYGCIRLHNQGKGMIGPVYADNETVAEVLIYNLIKSCIAAQTKGLLFMTLSTSLGGMRIAQKMNLRERERCERVFTKHPIPAEYKYIYCIHSPDFSL